MILRAVLATGLIGVFASAAFSQSAPGNPNQPPEHVDPFPILATGNNREDARKSIELGPQMQRGVPAREMLKQRRRLDRALGRLPAQQPGVIDAYVVAVALDSDPVFAREAREAGRVLARRYNAGERMITLAGPDGTRDDLPQGSIDALTISLARIAELMDPDEDVLVLYSTSHGIELGLTYHYGDSAFGILSPERFKSVLEELGIERRILILSACFSGVFVPALASPDSVILTAAADNRTSFGCEAENDWTFFGDALINRALRQPQGLEDAARAASRTVAGWEANKRLLASLPQASFGERTSEWLPMLEARVPRVASKPVGRPAIGE